MRILSLGAGVQSSTVALMMAHGEIEPAHHAIFADTHAEPESVYRWLDWLTPKLPFPVHRVTAGSLTEAIMVRVRHEKTGSGGPPFFVRGGRGMLPRQCTRDYKLVPIERQIRKLIGLAKGARGPSEVVAESVIGISYDEALRIKPSRLSFVRNVYPLVDRDLTRWHCLEWMRSHGYPQPPRSACVYCPYRSDDEWTQLKANDPAGFEAACSTDDAIRGGYVGSTDEIYVHRSGKPLREVDFSDVGQGNLFVNECEGMCGV